MIAAPSVARSSSRNASAAGCGYPLLRLLDCNGFDVLPARAPFGHACLAPGAADLSRIRQTGPRRRRTIRAACRQQWQWQWQWQWRASLHAGSGAGGWPGDDLFQDHGEQGDAGPAIRAGQRQRRAQRIARRGGHRSRCIRLVRLGHADQHAWFRQQPRYPADRHHRRWRAQRWIGLWRRLQGQPLHRHAGPGNGGGEPGHCGYRLALKRSVGRHTELPHRRAAGRTACAGDRRYRRQPGAQVLRALRHRRARRDHARLDQRLIGAQRRLDRR